MDSSRQQLWYFTYATDERVLTGGVIAVDLSQDGSPELVFNSYSSDDGKGQLFVLDGGGNLQHQLALPARDAMSVPTAADVDGDGTLEILVRLKRSDNDQEVLVYNVPASAENCLLWPTGRGNYLRDGHLASP